MVSTDPATPPVGPWVFRWLSAARIAKYRSASGGDLSRALALYERNARISAALMRDVDSKVAALNRLRNRVAHHEPLIAENLPREAAKVCALGGLIDPELGEYLTATSAVPALLLERPS